MRARAIVAAMVAAVLVPSAARQSEIAPSRGWELAPAVTSALIVAGVTLPNRILHRDHIVRRHKWRPWPTRLFALLRLCDPIACYALLRRRTMNSRDYLFLCMSAMGALRHWLWATKINLNDWTWELAVTVAAFNFWFDWTHAQNLLRRPRPLNAVACAGAACFVAGTAIESVSELQRAAFKRRTAPRSRLYTRGLFRFATNINYLGYILWRAGIGLVSAPPHTLAYALYHAVDFRLRAIPLLHAHMHAKYGEEWSEYAARTRRLIPFLL